MLFDYKNIVEVYSNCDYDPRVILKKSDNTYWFCGINAPSLRMDMDYELCKFNFIKKNNINDVKKVVAAPYVSYYLKNNNELWASGRCTEGTLGANIKQNASAPIKVIDDVKDFSARFYHVLVIKNDGTVWAAGKNMNGELGQGITEAQWNTTAGYRQVPGISNAVQVSAGFDQSAIVLADGSLYTSGNNEQGELCVGDKTNRSTFTKANIDNVKKVVCPNHSLMILKNDGTVWRSNGSGGVHNVGLTDVIDIEAGRYSYYCIKADGTVWVSGSNGWGQLGLGHYDAVNGYIQHPTMTNLKQISGHSSDRVFFLKEDGSLWASGRNSDGGGQETVPHEQNMPLGALGCNSFNPKECVPQRTNLKDIICVSTGFSHSLAVNKFGEVFSTGENIAGAFDNGYLGSYNDCVLLDIPEELKNKIKNITFTTYNIFIETTDNEVWSNGINRAGLISSSLPQGVIKDFVKLNINLEEVDRILYCNIMPNIFIIKKDKTLWGNGDNSIGQLTGTADADPHTDFIHIVDGVKNIEEHVVGYGCVFILKENGDLLGLGIDYVGGFGINQVQLNTPTLILSGVDSIHTGYYSNFAQKTNGELWVSGYDMYYNAGLGGTIDFNASPMVQIPVWTQCANFPVDKKVKKLLPSMLYNGIIMEDNTYYMAGLLTHNLTEEDVKTERLDAGIKTKFEYANENVLDVFGYSYGYIAQKSDGIYASGLNTGATDVSNKDLILNDVKINIPFSNNLFIHADKNNNIMIVDKDTGHIYIGAQLSNFALGLHFMHYDPNNYCIRRNEFIGGMDFPIQKISQPKTNNSCYISTAITYSPQIIKSYIRSNDYEIVFTDDGLMYVKGDITIDILGKSFEGYKIHFPSFVEFDINMDSIKYSSCSDKKAMTIDENNDLYVLGSNEYGELGVGHNNHVDEYIKIAEKIDKVQTFDKLTVFKDKNGKYHVAGIYVGNKFIEYKFNK